MKETLPRKLIECMKMFAVFFKIGLFSFGGGYAMLTMIEHEVVDKKNWLTHNELMDIFAIAESTPGAISINIATFIGTKREGVLGGVLTTFGVVLPAFLVILGLSFVLDIVRDNKWVNYLFTGVRVGVIVLIVHAAVKFLTNMKKKPLSILLMLAMFCMAVFTDVSVIYLMLGAIGVSVAAVALNHIIKKRALLAAMTQGADEYSRNASHAASDTCPEELLNVNLPPAADALSAEHTASETPDAAPTHAETSCGHGCAGTETERRADGKDGEDKA